MIGENPVASDDLFNGDDEILAQNFKGSRLRKCHFNQVKFCEVRGQRAQIVAAIAW